MKRYVVVRYFAGEKMPYDYKVFNDRLDAVVFCFESGGINIIEQCDGVVSSVEKR